ncbi:MAG: carbohydrate ABC transporter permease, partial [Angelakisella sp.]
FLFSLVFVMCALVAVVPVVFTGIISVTSEASIAKNGYSFFPEEFSLEAYRYIWEQGDVIFRAFCVSIFITVLGTIVGLSLMASMGYVISRRSFPFRKFFNIMIVIPLVFSGGMVANYLVITQLLNLKDTIWVLILPSAVSTFYIMVLRTFFTTSVPEAIVESAKIDGASQLTVFLRIVLPISLPALATVGLMLSFRYWNEWFSAMMYLDEAKLFPLQYVLISIENDIEFLTTNSQMIGSGVIGMIDNLPSETARMALVMIVVLPIACIYPFFQQYFVSGLTVGATKE